MEEVCKEACCINVTLREVSLSIFVGIPAPAEIALRIRVMFEIGTGGEVERWGIDVRTNHDCASPVAVFFLVETLCDLRVAAKILKLCGSNCMPTLWCLWVDGHVDEFQVAFLDGQDAGSKYVE